VGIIQNPHDVGADGRQTVLWTIEKNRRGPTDVAMIFKLEGRHFYFDPQGMPFSVVNRGAEITPRDNQTE
jgi:hypothetical protein